MIKSIGEVSVNASDNGGGVAKFDFSSETTTISSLTPTISSPNVTVNEKDKKGGTYSISTARNGMVEEIKKAKDYGTYFSGCNFNKEEVSDDKKSLTLYIQFTLKGGYALDVGSNYSLFLTGEGLCIRLVLNNEGQTWVE